MVSKNKMLGGAERVTENETIERKVWKESGYVKK